MKLHLVIATLLLMPWLATAENGVTTLSQQQHFLDQRDQQMQQQRMLNNQQMEQRREQQNYQLKFNQPKMLPDNGNNNPMRPMTTQSGGMLQSGNQPRNPFDRTTPSVPQVPLPATSALP